MRAREGQTVGRPSGGGRQTMLERATKVFVWHLQYIYIYIYIYTYIYIYVTRDTYIYIDIYMYPGAQGQ